MAFGGRDCPDCRRRVREPFQKTVTGREVCPDCANALLLGTAAGVTTGNIGSGYGVLAMLMRKIRRTEPD
ncbi:hypothetical protein Aab01nite_00340 [Paractinoplanes abujensis]|uniref:Uncharacterized protein n=1 Tax=Paractinoplanes abujensis TaxID=882441 RepID=A0A7W7G2Y6_9ACTN|nr:hypothetical protein [Actinoplanes abujensis]GID16444.1 hypothetical protein Aab01nite_00340 [Actinoplanes abujensis]